VLFLKRKAKIYKNSRIVFHFELIVFKIIKIILRWGSQIKANASRNRHSSVFKKIHLAEVASNKKVITVIPVIKRKMKGKSRTIGFSKTIVNTALWIAEILRLKSVSCDFEQVDLLMHQYLQLRESNIDFKH